MSGYYNADSKEPLFTVNVVGQGTVSGVYRLVDNGGGDIFYLDNCCAGVTISSLPQPWTYADIGTVGQKGRCFVLRLRQRRCVHGTKRRCGHRD